MRCRSSSESRFCRRRSSWYRSSTCSGALARATTRRRMGEETTWFDFLPGVKNLEEFARQYLGRSEAGVQAFPSAFSLTHVFAVLLVLLFVTVGAVVFRASVARGGREA